MRKLVTTLAVLAAFPAQAADKLVFTGAEVSGHRSMYGQVGGIQPLPGSTLGNGWALRGVVDGLTYKYKGATDIDADSAGLQFTGGYQSSGQRGWWALYTGPAYRYTELSPNDPGNEAEGSDFSWVIQAEAERNLSKEFKVNVGGNYLAGGNNAYWGRTRLLYRLSGNMFVGPEVIAQGDDEYNAYAIGAAITGIELAKNTTLGLKAGARKSEDFSTSPYVGFEVGITF